MTLSIRRAARRTAFVITLAAIPLFSGACSEDRQQPIFDPDFGHPANWVSEHGQAALTEGSSCPECHGTDLGGGATSVSCFETRENSTGCHESGTSRRHTTGWGLSTEHGRAAKARPGISSGLGSCQACHGNDYGGGTSQIACSSCHGVEAPHPESPWRSPSSHTTTNEQNAPVCVECHANPESDQPPGCFNGSLCHGEESSHPPGWSAAGQHGAQAKAAAGDGGFRECQVCHGDDFQGGTSGVLCSSCHGGPAPHPLQGWAGGGEGHRDTDDSNAAVCAVCHDEISAAGGCFTANACHPGDAGGAPGAGETPSEGAEDAAEPPDG